MGNRDGRPLEVDGTAEVTPQSPLSHQHGAGPPAGWRVRRLSGEGAPWARTRSRCPGTSSRPSRWCHLHGAGSPATGGPGGPLKGPGLCFLHLLGQLGSKLLPQPRGGRGGAGAQEPAMTYVRPPGSGAKWNTHRADDRSGGGILSAFPLRARGGGGRGRRLHPLFCPFSQTPPRPEVSRAIPPSRLQRSY